MFDVSLGEAAVVLTVIVAVVGPKELPGTLRTAMRTIGKVREITAEVRAGVDRVLVEARITETQERIRQEMAPIVDLHGELQQTFDLSDLHPDFGKEHAETPPGGGA